MWAAIGVVAALETGASRRRSVDAGARRAPDFGEPSAGAKAAAPRRNRGAAAAAPGEETAATEGATVGATEGAKVGATEGAFLSAEGFVPKPGREPFVVVPIADGSRWLARGAAADVGGSTCGEETKLWEARGAEPERRAGALDPTFTFEGAGEDPGGSCGARGGGDGRFKPPLGAGAAAGRTFPEGVRSERRMGTSGTSVAAGRGGEDEDGAVPGGPTEGTTAAATDDAGAAGSLSGACPFPM